MSALGVAAAVRWGINGNSILTANWHAAQPSSIHEIVKQIFLGVSLGFLAYTGKSLKYYVIDSRFRVNAKLYRGSSSRSFSQGLAQPLAPSFFTIDLDDVICLGRCSVL